MDIADVLSRVTAQERLVEICVDGSIAPRLDDLQQRWLDAVRWDREHNTVPTAPAIQAEVDALRAEASEATVAFRVRSMGAAAWRRLVADYPPPPDDLDGWRWNLELFPPAALAASCADPVMSEGEAQELAERLSDGAWQKLFAAVLEVNMRDDTPKFALGTADPPSTEPNSTTALPEGSLGPSS